MTLGEVIEELEKHERSIAVPFGFHNPHSYRGYYEELAFEPLESTTVGAMLDAAKSAVNQTYKAYKGGDYLMDESTPVHLAQWGSCGEAIGKTLLCYMTGEF